MATYVDGYVLVVKKKDLAAYRRMAQMGSKVWRKYGALDYKECMIDDPKPKHVVLTFPKMIKAKNNEELFSYIFAHSRFCSTHAYGGSTSHKKAIKKIEKHSFEHSVYNYAGIAYALMNRMFIEQMEKEGIEIKFMTSQLNSIMTDVILSFSRGNTRTVLPFEKAHVKLDIDHPSKLFIDRNRALYALSCPGYFLDIRDILKLFQRLHEEGKLDKELLREYFPGDRSLETIMKNPHIRDFRFLGKLFTHNGSIIGSSITGQELRDIINKEVQDAPTLYLMHIDEWKKGIDDMISFAKL
jgi:uncharacterized protein YbaA (DUF1428 family)